MLVGINTLYPDSRSGFIDRYLRRVLQRAQKLQPETEYIILAEEPDRVAVKGVPVVQVSGGMGGWHGLFGGGSGVEKAAKKAGVDLLLSPLEAALPSTSLAQVIYVPHVSPWESRQDQGRPLKGEPPPKHLRRACAGARAVITPSQYIRRRCLEIFDVPLDRTVVAPPGVDPIFKTKQDTMVEPPYLMMFLDGLATIQLDLMKHSVKLLEKEFPQTIVIAGPAAPGEPDEWGKHVVRIEYCPDAQLTGLYQNCQVFVHTFLHDGHAMAVLEALHAGAPVVAPRSGAIMELVAQAPVYFNPESDSALVQAIRRILSEDPERVQSRVHEGQRATAESTWEKCAWRFLNAFKKI